MRVTSYTLRSEHNILLRILNVLWIRTQLPTAIKQKKIYSFSICNGCWGDHARKEYFPYFTLIPIHIQNASLTKVTKVGIKPKRNRGMSYTRRSTFSQLLFMGLILEGFAVDFQESPHYDLHDSL